MTDIYSECRRLDDHREGFRLAVEKPSENEILDELPEHCCYTCDMWCASANDAAVVYAAWAWGGQCRINAPAVNPGHSNWPRTSANQWCGKWRLRCGAVKQDYM